MILLILKEETFFQVLFYFQVYISILSLSLLPLSYKFESESSDIFNLTFCF